MRSVMSYYPLAIIAILVTMQLANAQILMPQEMVTYQRQSSFIKEFPVPEKELGLEGITTDTQGGVWFLHSSNKTSTIFQFEPSNGEFNRHPVPAETAADNQVINLAAGHLVFDNERSVVWFTDPRSNSIGKLDTQNGRMQLIKIPTQNAGPMDIALSPDSKSIWFAEITGDKIAQVDIESMKITEYLLAEDSGPALITFDDNGTLWVSLSFSNSVLRVDPQANTPPSSPGYSYTMTEFNLPGERGDTFSPFGIAVSGGKVYVSDHGSSRVIVSDTGFVNHISYWTSPSNQFPTTLPGEIVTDKDGNVYFPQHGGNRISMISKATGMMTEYEIPTGPLSTTLFLATSDDGKIWFTEWAANKISYLNTNVKIPFDIQVTTDDPLIITKQDKSESSESINVSFNASVDRNHSSVSLSEVQTTVIGMSDSGPRGIITFDTAQPPRLNLSQNHQTDVKIDLTAESTAVSGKYTLMVGALASEDGGPFISKLYPIPVILDISSSPQPQTANGINDDNSANSLIRNLLRYGSLSAAAGLGGYIIYRLLKIRKFLYKR